MEALEDKCLYDLLTETKGSFCIPLTLLTYLINFTESHPHPLTPPPDSPHIKQGFYNPVLPTILFSTL